jgi:hypothetical protein
VEAPVARAGMTAGAEATIAQLRRYEPDGLLVEVSRQRTRVCLVLGWGHPNSDDQASLFIYAGRSSLHRSVAQAKERTPGRGS